MSFEFATADKIIFGAGTALQIGKLASGFGHKALVVFGKSFLKSHPIMQDLKAHGIQCECFRITKEPTVPMVMAGANKARRAACDVVIAIGGGSVIDSGKVIAALLTNQGDLYDYLETIGKGQAIINAPAPFLALPTTAGTGTEVTCNSVLISPEHEVKVSMRSHLMLPKIAIIDPELTYSMPPSITANTGMDAITQLIEAFVSRDSNPLTDGICREGLMRTAGSMEKVFLDGSNIKAREDMCIASLFGGIALANAKLGAVHGIAGPLGGMYPSSHGGVCGRLLPFVMATNIAALKNRFPASDALTRYKEIARMVTGNLKASALESVIWVQNLCDSMGVAPLSRYGVHEKDIDRIVERSQKASSMRGNPVQLKKEELQDILQQAL